MIINEPASCSVTYLNISIHFLHDNIKESGGSRSGNDVLLPSSFRSESMILMTINYILYEENAVWKICLISLRFFCRLPAHRSFV